MTTETLFSALKAACPADWDAYIRHDFVRQLATGTLAQHCFQHYLAQDYLFLIHFSRAWALAVVKCEQLADMREATATLNALLQHEMQLHVEYCARWGISAAQLAALEEEPANIAYTRFVLERGYSGDLLDLLTALAPCVLGYAEIGRWISTDAATRLHNNPYGDWIAMYAGAEYQAVAAAASAFLQRTAQRALGSTPLQSERWPALCRTFRAATRLEVAFWQMGLDAAP